MSNKRNIRLECSVCKHINYLTTKNAKTVPNKLEQKKYCKFCRKVTLHKETKSK